MDDSILSHDECDLLELFDVKPVKVLGEQRWLGKIKDPSFPNGKTLAIFKLKGELVAIHALCPHEAYNLIDSELVGQAELECAVHGNRYTIGSGSLPSYKVIMKGDNIYVVRPK